MLPYKGYGGIFSASSLHKTPEILFCDRFPEARFHVMTAGGFYEGTSFPEATLGEDTDLSLGALPTKIFPDELARPSHA